MGTHGPRLLAKAKKLHPRKTKTDCLDYTTLSLAGLHRPKAWNKLDLNWKQTCCRHDTKIHWEMETMIEDGVSSWLCRLEMQSFTASYLNSPTLASLWWVLFLLHFFLLLFLIPGVKFVWFSGPCNSLNSERLVTDMLRNLKSCACFLRERPLENPKAIIENLYHLK